MLRLATRGQGLSGRLPVRRRLQLPAAFVPSPRGLSTGSSSGSGDVSARSSVLDEAAAAGKDVEEPSQTAKPKAKPVDTTTSLDVHREVRRVERRIEDHVRAIAAGGGAEEHCGDSSSSSSSAAFEEAAERLSAEAEAAAAARAALPPGSPPALRIRDPNAVADGAGKDVVVRSRTTTGQVLWPATKEDIEILSESNLMYPAPYEVEGSVIIRLVRLSDPVTSPVARVMRNRQFGIRGNEKWQLLAMGVVSMLIVYSLGAWQLKRMKWKKELVEMRRTRLAMPKIEVRTSPFPWKDQVDDYVYRVVEVRGVFDHDREMHVGPRPGADESGETVPGVLVVTPLRLEDGSTVMVNRGHLPANRLDRESRPELPTWVRVRGVLEEGEIPNLVGKYARLKNRPDKKQYHYLIAPELAENACARNHEECSQALVTAIDVLFEDDFKAGMRRQLPYTMKHKEDYLLFWADEHTHFNYAMQWFGMGTLLLVMTFYKFVEVSRWRF
eukprot:TRINITY_DN103386_c0_g1_i1.p1 TRINITY_DN103386_c0_g1~~TRINITY_DN103386_c0_g1_i1.p1  ORF type:complete len:498 (+),score=88.92 TRINITY_DN103386_c0_g1_i1:31-1524(+)